jgi:hypothetical protein
MHGRGILMTVAVEVAFHGHGATLENYKKSLTLLGATPGGPHPDPSCLFHWAAETGGGVHVTDVWKTKQAFETFAADKLASVMQEVGIPEPQIKFIDVASFLTTGS